MLRKFLPDQFILAIVVTLILAAIVPASGLWAIWIDRLAVAAIILLFFFHGAKLRRSEIIQGLTHWRLHSTVLMMTFLIFPIIMFSLHSLMPGILSETLWTGLLFLSLLPSTVQSSVIFTSIAKGNVSAAIASASASQLFGVFLTPLLVALLMGASSVKISATGLVNIGLIIFLPFALGHGLRPMIKEWVDKNRSVIRLTDRAAIILAVFSAFSAATLDGLWSQIPVSTFAILLAICAFVFAVILGLTLLAGHMMGLSLENRHVLVFCGSKKSLVQGIPMARILFAGPELGLILLPIMVFHQMQLMICAWIAQFYGRQISDIT